MKKSSEDHAMAHGFFHTMVVMGSALALGCGGESRSTHGVPDGTAGMNTDGAGGGAGNGGTGGGTLPGGAGTGALGGGAGLGGSAGTGGIIVIGGTGGGGTAGSAGAPPTLNCPPSQYTCQYGGCDGFNVSDTQYCTCDLSRPQTPLDCGDDGSKTMVCFDGVQYNASGNVVSQHVPYECQCFEKQPDCATACQTAVVALNRGPYSARCLNPDPNAALDPTEPVLCGCAPIVLK